MSVFRASQMVACFFACVSALPLPAAQAMTVREYETQRDSADLEAYKTTKIYLNGVGVGYAWANSERVAEKLQPLFCLPQDFQRRSNFVALLEDEIGQRYVTRDDAVELLLLGALRRVYPCPRAKPFVPDDN
jgi:hypothetical protein